MPDVIAQVTLKNGGKYHAPGSVVTIPTKKEADDLVARGFAEFADEGGSKAKAKKGAKTEGEKDPPSGFDALPGAAALKAAGIESIDAVPRSMEELVALEGIGEATAEKILEAIEAAE